MPPLVHLCPLASRLGREVLKISKYQTIIPWNPVPCAVVPCGVPSGEPTRCPWDAQEPKAPKLKIHPLQLRLAPGYL